MKKIPKVVLLIESSRAFGRELQSGIARYARLHGPWSFYREPRGLTSAIPRIENSQADGIITRNTPVSENILKFKIPVIAVLHYPDRNPDIPAVLTDNEYIARLAAEHLLNRGFQNFGYCGFKNLLWSDERGNYFKSFIDQTGNQVSIFKQSRSKTEGAWEIEISSISKWLKKLSKPVAIMACNDDKALQVLEACKLEGFHVPEEVAVVGVDNDTLICELADPPLSSIALGVESAGYRTAELLDKLMNGKKGKIQDIIVSPSHVVGRQSTDILAIKDIHIVKALAFIRTNSYRKISVTDVVGQTAISRRSLENRFKKNLGRSIQQEIRRIRVELITQMLIETEMSISEITSSLEFADIDHISRYFRKEKGMGLRDFRKLQKQC
jgi:LacI family transcriptional regulator